MAERQPGWPLTGRQQEVWRLYQEGNSMRKIGSLLGISVSVVHQYVQAIRRKLQEREELAQLMEEVPGGTARTISELQVLALASKGMTVKQAASHLNRSENSVRMTLHRNGISAKEFLRRKLTIQEKEEYSRIKPPCEEEKEKLEDGFLLRVLRACEGEGVPSAGLEVVLRAAGLIHKTPKINANRRTTLNTLRAQSRDYRVAFILSRAEMKALRKELKRCGINRGWTISGPN